MVFGVSSVIIACIQYTAAGEFTQHRKQAYFRESVAPGGFAISYSISPADFGPIISLITIYLWPTLATSWLPWCSCRSCERAAHAPSFWLEVLARGPPPPSSKSGRNAFAAKPYRRRCLQSQAPGRWPLLRKISGSSARRDGPG